MDEEKIRLALAIVDSEAFMWIMSGTGHLEAHRRNLYTAWRRYRDLGGGWGQKTDST